MSIKYLELGHKNFLWHCCSVLLISLYEISLLVYESQVYIHYPTQHFALQSYITWQLVLALNVGRHQASRT